MKIGKFKLSRRAVSPVIATLLMIAIAVAASIIVYVWSIGLLGGLMQSGGGSQTAEQMILEAFDGVTKLTVRNVDTRNINVTACYLDGVSQASACPAAGTIVSMGTSKQFTLGSAPAAGSHVVKFISKDGAVFIFSIVGGQPSIIALRVQAVKRFF